MFQWGVFTLFIVSSCMAPGPNTITGMTMACAYGIRQSFKYAAGVFFGIFGVAFLCCLFNSAISSILPSAKTILAILGALYFLYLAVVTFRSKPLTERGEGKKPSGFLAGVAVQIVNPQAIFFCLGAVSAYIAPYYSSITAYMFFSAVMAFIASAITVLYGFFGMIIQRFFSKHYRIINAILALLLVYCAVMVFLGIFR